MTDWTNKGPVVVGGVGGSGTRVVAKILEDIGYYMGSDLNEALDNLWFTLLFKRPAWFCRQKHLQAQVIKGLTLFEKRMKNEGRITSSEWLFLISAAFDLMLHGHDHLGSGSGIWPLIRMKRLLASRGKPDQAYSGWGWKEPNAHIYLECLNQHFPGLKFILVIRHGLDIAAGKNQAQLYNWGPLFGVAPPRTHRMLPAASLEYWIKANQTALSKGRQCLKDRFYVVRFDDLQKNPRTELDQLLAFLDYRDRDAELIDRLTKDIAPPRVPARWQNVIWPDLPAAYLEDVRKMGFSIQTDELLVQKGPG